MSTIHKTISSLVKRQLPDFVNADHPQFKLFIEYYYKWLEDPEGGNTVFHIMNSDSYRDIDETLDPFIRLFKEEFLPNFPEKTALDVVKILKRSREFYARKGSEESVKWLFRVLFDQEVELFYPKKQILKVSDGKWKLPLAFRITLSTENEDIDPNLLEKLKGEGSISTATCVIESANKTVDKNFGNEVLEIYVSNVVKDFINGEFLIIQNVEGYTAENPFKEKIIGSLSNIKVDSNIITDPQQKRRGLLYNVGDPIVVFGGLDNTPQARDAVAYVEDVTSGSIEGININFPGYGYRTEPNSVVTVLRTIGVDDPNSNLSTSILVSALELANVSGSSQSSFLEYLPVDKMPIEYIKSVGIGATNYSLFTQNNRNVVLNVTENQNLTLFEGDYVYANGVSLSSANFIGRILSTTNLIADTATNIVLYSVANTRALTTTGFLVGTNKLFVPNVGSVINVNSVVNAEVPANANSQIKQTLNYEILETGGVQLFTILNGGYGFRSTPRVEISSYHDTYWSEAELIGSSRTDPDYVATRQSVKNYGKISHIYIDNGGSGYANGDQIIITGRGYGFVGNVNVGANGTIVSTNIIDRGEGYYIDKNISIVTSGGSGATLTAYEFNDGVEYAIDTGAIGRIKSIKLTNRGYDYISIPLVSLKVLDIMIIPIPEIDIPNLAEGNYIYQGDIDFPSFYSIIKKYDSSNGLLRTFNYSGNFDRFNTIKVGKTVITDDIETEQYLATVTISPTATVPVPDQYPAGATLGNPVFYGNGKAKAVAEFFNGLIKFDGFYVNTDGFLSADKKIQDSKTYHNYSYVIQSEKSLVDYENIIKDTVHPIGTSMLSKTISYVDTENDGIAIDPYVYILPPISTTSNIQVANALSNVVTGNSTTFTANLVGNLINLIDQTAPGRSFSKVVTAVTSPTSLNVEGNFIMTGQGYINSQSQNIANSGLEGYVYGRYEPRSGLIRVSDLNTRVFSTNTLLNGIVSVYSINATVSGVNTIFLDNILVGDLISVNNEIRVVVANTSNTELTVNSNFSANSTNVKIRKLSSNLLTFTVNDILYTNNEERKITQILSPEYIIVDSEFSSKNNFATYFKANSSVATRYLYRNSGDAIATAFKVNDIVSVNNEIRRIIRLETNYAETNAPFSYTTTSQWIDKLQTTALSVSDNQDIVANSVSVGDTIKINVASINEFPRQLQVTGGNLSMNIVSGSSIANARGTVVLNVVVKKDDVIMINNQYRTVVNVNGTALIVNTAFTTTSNGEFLYKRLNVVDANVIAIDQSTITTNIDFVATNTISNLVYFVVPKYDTKDYPYSIILTS
jgi:hypothetical protein